MHWHIPLSMSDISVKHFWQDLCSCLLELFGELIDVAMLLRPSLVFLLQLEVYF